MNPGGLPWGLFNSPLGLCASDMGQVPWAAFSPCRIELANGRSIRYQTPSLSPKHSKNAEGSDFPLNSGVDLYPS